MYKVLSKVKSNDGVVFANIPSSPGVHCPMHTSLASIRKLEGISSLVVGMPECSFYSRYVVNEQKEQSIHYTYVLDSNEVVFGSKEGLKEALIEMAKDGAINIVVIKTCIPSLIGEDIEGISEEVCEQYNIKIAIVDLAHYKTNGYTTGYQLTNLALLDFIDIKPDHQVNLLGDVGGEELEHLKTEIKKSYTCFSYGYQKNYAQFLKLGNGSYNIVFSASFLELAKEMKKRFGIPYIYFSAYNLSEVNDRYQEIEKLLNINIQYQSNSIDTIVDTSKSYISLISHMDGIELLGILDHLHIKVHFMHIEEFSDAILYARDRIQNNDPQIAYVSESEDFLNSTSIPYDICLQDSQAIFEALQCIGSERIGKIYTYINRLGGE